eukprot:4409348-Alexandrium_andersonii.AAC.1
MLGSEAEARGLSDELRVQRAKRPQPLSGDLLPERHSPCQWLQHMQDAGSGTDRPHIGVISELRRQIWLQTESAVMSEVQQEDPE